MTTWSLFAAIATLVLLVATLLFTIFYQGSKRVPGPTPGPTPKPKPGHKYPVIKTYRIAPTTDGLKNHNTGDVVGDNAYISGEFCHRHPDQIPTAILSEYQVEYVPDFGNYAYCNPGGYIGGSGDYRCSCAAHSYDPQPDCLAKPGRAHDRFSGGWWYSWPQESMAKNETDLGKGSARWKLLSVGAAVPVQHLIDQGYKYVSDKMAKQWHSEGMMEDNIAKFVEQHKDSNIALIKKVMAQPKSQQFFQQMKRF